MTKIIELKQVFGLYAFIFIFWGLYRFLFRLPLEIEEIILKPIVWLVPVFWLLWRRKENLPSIGWSGKNIFKSLYLGIGLGIIFAIEGFLANNLKYGGISLVRLSYSSLDLLLAALGVSFVTAVVEETVFRGYIFSRLWRLLKDELQANLISSSGWMLIHLPISIFVLHYTPSQVFVYLLLTFIFGVGSAFVYGRTGTIIAPVLLHVFWSWPITLFR
jgi:hypothetical protein